ncbi:MAG: spore coat protein U domain-containing protein [Gammaproteobacteria bacterium]|nr:spore coat protein U domain-containing protein [Gammaproteobacteria bacterium]MDE1984711.1 spore coat protein U domain-containing protein [Gammaproteobacteria bacterium]MDE2109044.1 spore coat protein U domain-containing protein [Gammaproteobacteria bacterium]MDE2461456.1 spore coat protein U domain-containing protein [Gammaproteobacteria bacterium]
MLFSALILALLLAGILAVAPVTVRAANCTVSTRALAFGNYNLLNAAAHNVAPVIIVAACTGRGTLTAALSTGQSNSYINRYMTSSTTSDQLNYQLYTSVAHTTIWGDGTSATAVITRSIRNNSLRLRAFGQIPALENIAAGKYTDLITATVSF